MICYPRLHASNFVKAVCHLTLWKMWFSVVLGHFCIKFQETIYIYFLASVPNSEDQISVSAPEGLLSYSQREWKGNTNKSHLIRKVK